MSDLLRRMSLIIGGMLFFISLILGIVSHGGITGAVLFRSLMVLILGTMTVGIFFRFFSNILYNFVVEKMEESQQEADELNAVESEDIPLEELPKR